MERVYAVSTRLHLTEEWMEYLKEYIKFYHVVQRRIFQDLNHGIMEKMGRSQYVSYLCSSYGILKRTGNAILYDMKGRIKAYHALKKTELSEMQEKLKAVKKSLHKKQAVMEKLKPKAAKNTLSSKDLITYRNAKKSLYWLKNKQNTLVQKIDGLKRQIKERTVSLCFGSKAMFGKQYRLAENNYKSHEKWLHDFQKRRDSGIFYLGSSDETCGNQLLQMHVGKDGFRMELSKDKPFRKDGNKKLIQNSVVFPYMQEELTQAIQNHQPVTYKITRKDKKWYVTAMFRMDREVRTDREHGVFGIDYNDGFMEMAEINEHGNLVSRKHIDILYHGTGNRAESELKESISKIVRHALYCGKSIVVEDLDFKKKKAETQKHQKKLYNKMIHQLDYHRYLFWLENLCLKYGVGFLRVNPAYTSQIGKQKYADQKKLTVHECAAFVIARRGQGFVDKLTS